ncbi:phosphotyrosine protein phosphatase [Roseobacter ponti]|uniref:Phosphotyrosine protein phosphatase n=1 Tax=Roseobacter ponti TaxID=1891787 RepID=A0A858SU45_9RHOB|nr:phosphotyrosine protein phosphatase [Roseobacter ponti]QJF52479.1 phosphotyrosine protein phosphatase [Roseobacter ponti]
MRSPTAADLVAAWDGFETDFAGLSRDADEQLSVEQIAWADLIVVMEKRHKTRLTAAFGTRLKDRRVVVLGIPDRYNYMQPELVARLEPALRRLLNRRS